MSVQHQQSSLSLALESKGQPCKGRGRGVRLRGGGAGRGIRGGRSHGELEEESEDSSSSSSSSSTNSSSSDEEGEEKRGENGVRGVDKENQPQSRKGGRAPKEREEEGCELGEDEEDEMEQDGHMGDTDGLSKESNLKVTLQKPSRTKQDPSAIVPKLEAISSQSTTSTIQSQARALARPPIRNRGPGPEQHSNTHTAPFTRSRHTDTRSAHPERSKVSKPRLDKPAKLNNGASSSSTSELLHLRVPLSALQEGGSEADRDTGGSGPSCEREVWVSVFRYLSRADLCVCMAVCKNWYKW